MNKKEHKYFLDILKEFNKRLKKIKPKDKGQKMLIKDFRKEVLKELIKLDKEEEKRILKSFKK